MCHISSAASLKMRIIIFREILELEELLPLIREKIQDTAFMKQEIIRKLKEQMAFSKGDYITAGELKNAVKIYIFFVEADLDESAKPINNIAVKRRN